MVSPNRQSGTFARLPRVVKLLTVLGFAIPLLWLVGPGWLLDVPSYRLTLVGTVWGFEGIDGVPSWKRYPTIEFVDGSTVRVNTGCREVETEFAQDTDGAALGFGLIPPADPPCPPWLAEQDAAIVDALATTDRWSYQSDIIISFHGAHEIRLSRGQSDLD